MTRFRASRLLLAFLALLAPGASDGARGQQPAASSRRPPNVVLILVDDLGWRDLGCYGSALHDTPRIDGLAREGLVFTDAYSSAPNCAPTRAALLSGQWAPRTGVYTVGSPARGKKGDRRLVPVPNRTDLDPAITTFAEALSRAGYTSASIGKWHLGPDPTEHGFAVNVAGDEAGSPRGGYFSPYKNPHLADGPDGESLTARLTSEALAFVRENAERPFLLYLSHFAVHTPVQGEPALVREYRARRAAGWGGHPAYAAMVKSVDDSTGRILDELERLELAGNTLVIFTSDNGGHARFTSMEPLRGSKGMLYEGGVRVPLIVRWPGVVEPGRTSAEPASSIDLYPTLLAAAGVPPPAGHVLDGVSLMPLLRGSGDLGREALYWHFPAYLEGYTREHGPWRTTPAGALRAGRWKLLEFFEDGRRELYDLVADPGETTDLAVREPERAAALHARLVAWRAETEAPVPTELEPEYVEAGARGGGADGEGSDVDGDGGGTQQEIFRPPAELLASLPREPGDWREPDEPGGPQRRDWLVRAPARVAGAYVSASGKELVLANGLVRRAFRLTPNAATVALDDLVSGAALLRAVEPEASVTLDGVEYAIGGLVGQPDRAYLAPEWLAVLEGDPAAFQLTGARVTATRAPFEWKRVRRAEDRPWPPAGVGLELAFAAPPGPHAGVTCVVRYELYDGLPLTCKELVLTNGSGGPLVLDAYVSDRLAAVEAESDVELPWRWRLPPIHVETDYACGGFTPKSALRTARWVPDPSYSSQVNYARQTPNLLLSSPPLGPAVPLQPGESLRSHRTFQLVFDSTERERRGLAVRRMYRTVAPWVTENPLLMHVRSAEPSAVRLAIDQCADVGFEMVIMTFGSGFSIENEDPAYVASIGELVDYAHSKGVELGGYSLLASRSISLEHDVIDLATGQPGGAKYGSAPCLESEWGREYFRKLRAFISETGLDLLEHDGSYPGDACASTSHPGHAGHADSQWRQFRRIADFYRWCRARGVSLNVPDWYFLNGSTKIGMGYRETNWSLPRERQVLLGRQNVYDGTWEKTPSMGWMFVPLVEYHGGGEAATLEPLDAHRETYGRHLANNLGLGVQACYRGPRLYDTPATRELVKGWVDFYRAHRAILESDVIHLRRADGRDVDGMLHVNPGLAECGLLALYNPLETDVERTLDVPLYYTGLTERARVRSRESGNQGSAGGQPLELVLDREYRVRLPVRVPARGWAWYSFEAP